MRLNKKHQTGSALILAMLTSGVGIGLIALMMSYSNRLNSTAGHVKRGERLKYAAKSGVEMAKADLEERADRADYATVTLRSPLTGSDYENVGLIRTTGGWAGRSPKPRLTFTSSDSTKVEVYYFPTAESGAASSGAFSSVYPKFFQVVSKAVNTKTGDVYSEESMVYIYQAGGASLAFGITEPSLKPGMTEYTFKPTTYNGHVHFGMTNSNLLNLNSLADIIGGSWDSYPYIFNGAVTFAGAVDQTSSGDPTLRPFRHSEYMALDFQKGYKALSTTENNSFKSLYDFPTIYSDALASSPSGVTSTDVCTSLAVDMNGRKRACILLKSDGTAKQYTCHTNPNVWDPTDRYVSGPSTTSDGTPTTTYAAVNSRMFKCSGGDIEVKGIYAKNFTFIAENIYIGGDIQNVDQSATSPWKLGLIAKDDLIIPTGVPAPRPDFHWQANGNMSGTDWNLDGTDDACPISDGNIGGNPYCYSGSWLTLTDRKKVSLEQEENYWTGVTNFLVSSDRDKQTGTYTSDYFENDKHVAWPHQGAEQFYPASFVPGVSTSTVGGVAPAFVARVRGEQNAPWILDLDVAAMAGGKIKMDGIWNFGENTNAASQVRITDINNVRYDAGSSLPAAQTAYVGDQYYKRRWNNGPTTRIAEPAYCCRQGGDWGSSGCPGQPTPAVATRPSLPCPVDVGGDSYSGEMVRPVSHSLVVFGSVVAKDYSNLSYNHNWKINQGFQKTFFKYDNRFAAGGPPGFPSSSTLEVDILWSKGSAGKSTTLSAAGL